MQGQMKKKPEPKFFEEPKFKDQLLEEKKQPQASNPIVLPSMSEGPMLLSEEQSKQVMEKARIQYAKSLALEINALKNKKKKKAMPPKTMQKKKRPDEPSPKK